MPQAEYTKVVRPCMKWLSDNGFLCWKNHGGAFSHKGLCDVMAIRAGRLYAFECKMPGNKATKVQEKFIRQVIEHGGVAGVVYSVEDMVELIWPS